MASGHFGGEKQRDVVESGAGALGCRLIRRDAHERQLLMRAAIEAHEHRGPDRHRSPARGDDISAIGAAQAHGRRELAVTLDRGSKDIVGVRLHRDDLRGANRLRGRGPGETNAPRGLAAIVVREAKARVTRLPSVELGLKIQATILHPLLGE